MKRGLIALVMGLALMGTALAQSGSVDDQHEAVMALIMSGNEALAEGADLAASDPKSACLAYRRAVTSFRQAATQTQTLRARLSPNDPAQADLIAHLKVMRDDIQTALATADTGVKTNCH